MQEQIDEITDAIAEMKAMRGESFTIKQLEKTRRSLEARMEKLQATERKDDVITFEQLGVDRPDDNGVIVPGRYPRTEFLAVGRLKVFFRGDQYLRAGVEPQKLAGPLEGQVVRHDKEGLLAQSQPLRLHPLRTRTGNRSGC